MNKKLHAYLIALPAVVLEYPFGPDAHVYKVEGKVFAIYFKNEQSESINLKCDPEQAEQLRSIFDEIKPGYHMNKKHWNTVDLTGQLPMGEVFRLAGHSYELVIKKLPKSVKQRLRLLHESLAWLN